MFKCLILNNCYCSWPIKLCCCNSVSGSDCGLWCLHSPLGDHIHHYIPLICSHFFLIFITILGVWTVFFRNVIGIREGFGVHYNKALSSAFRARIKSACSLKKSLELDEIERLTPGQTRSPSPLQHGSPTHHCFSHHHNSSYVSYKGSGEGPVLTAIMCNKFCLVSGSVLGYLPRRALLTAHVSQ